MSSYSGQSSSVISEQIAKLGLPKAVPLRSATFGNRLAQTLANIDNMIRKAKINEDKVLTEISFNSKGYWNYPDEYYKIWEKELTITSDYISKNDVYVYEQNGSITGYYSIVELKNDLILSDIKIEAGTWLEHMFISQSFIQKGIGKKLFLHCIEQYNSKSIKKLKILADPNSRIFYEKMGCNFINEYPSTIEGRTTPYLEYNFKNC